jgi:lipoyl(octanoyl) transferase
MIIQEFHKSTWRLLISPPGNGAWNMAVDEAILESIGGGISLPTLRLYAWTPPCLSIGFAQPLGDVNQEQIKRLGWDTVRRITGGRAILHTDELTYSVISPHTEPRLEGGILESYLRLSQALLNAVDSLGVPAQANPKTESQQSDQKKQKPVCFEVPSNYEITIHGKKLIGSAQARKKSGILQHGTLPLYGDLTRILKVIVLDGKVPDDDSNLNPKERLLNRATTLETALGLQISWRTAADALVESFKKTLNISFEESQLTPTEEKRACRLVNEKYAHPSWTARI